MSFLIYGLVDPNTQQLRYVGKSCSGLDRPRWHWTPSGLKERTKKAAWVKSLRFADQTPEVVVLEECSDAAELAESEIFWIQYFRMIGCNLTNMTGGGDGCAGRVVSQETRNKISSAQIGKKISSEQRRKISDARGITPEVEDRVRELFVASELGASKIASTVGISKRTVFLIAKRLNLYRPPNWKSRSVQEKKLTARKLRSEGLSLAAIGKQLGVSGSRVCVWCKH